MGFGFTNLQAVLLSLQHFWLLCFCVWDLFHKGKFVLCNRNLLYLFIHIGRDNYSVRTVTILVWMKIHHKACFLQQVGKPTPPTRRINHADDFVCCLNHDPSGNGERHKREADSLRGSEVIAS
jgi:hypothetical protein